MPKDELAKILEMQDNQACDKYQRDEYDNIGKRGVRRLDGLEKASGRAEYTMDVQLPGMLYLRFLTAPYAHCKIKSMDTSRAEALPGVRTVIRYDDEDLPPVADLGGHMPSMVPVLADVAHFQGEELGCAVVADTLDICDEALRLIEVDWEVRPFILDVDRALAEGADLVNPEEFPENNLEVEHEEGHGDVEKGFAESDHIMEFQVKRRNHTWVSPERACGVFRWNGEYPELWVKQQRPHVVKRGVCSWYGGIPMSRIQMHIPYQGASFGGWSQFDWNGGGNFCCSLAALRTGHPVKYVFTRREDFFGGSMDEGLYDFKVGYNSDGKIMAVRVNVMFANPMWEGFGPVTHFEDNTAIPNVYSKRKVTRVNKGINTAVRCEQLPNTMAFTMVFDKVADALGLDPMEVALKNDGCKGKGMDWVTEQKKEMGFTPRDSLKECIDKGKSAIGWDEKWHKPGAKKLANGRMHGIAFTWTHEWEDSCGSGEIAIRLERNDGTASILGMRCDNGVNAETAYCQIAADEIGMRLEDVYYRPQIDPGFFTMTPDSSTNMSVNGFAVRNAARLLREQIQMAVTKPRSHSQRGVYPPHFPDHEPWEVFLKDSVIYSKKDPNLKLTLAELVGPAGNAGPVVMHELYGAERHPYSAPLFAHSYQAQIGGYKGFRLKLCRQAHFMEVEVDTETGQIFITKVVNVNDVGKAVSPDTCNGQQYGGTYMGVGRMLSEEVVHDPVTGVMLNGNLLDYKIATIGDCGPIDTLLVETGQGYGPYGLVGLGEDIATVIPTLVVPAVYNAIGKWIYEFPLTPDRVLEALGEI